MVSCSTRADTKANLGYPLRPKYVPQISTSVKRKSERKTDPKKEVTKCMFWKFGAIASYYAHTFQGCIAHANQCSRFGNPCQEHNAIARGAMNLL